MHLPGIIEKRTCEVAGVLKAQRPVISSGSSSPFNLAAFLRNSFPRSKSADVRFLRITIVRVVRGISFTPEA